MSDQRPAPEGDEQTIAVTDIDPKGSALGVDDHLITPHPRGIGSQPTGGLDRGVETEHLASSSQGAKVEDAPDPGRDAPPSGENERA